MSDCAFDGGLDILHEGIVDYPFNPCAALLRHVGALTDYAQALINNYFDAK